jgi:hypothetical protein
VGRTGAYVRGKKKNTSGVSVGTPEGNKPFRSLGSK